jgi:glycosyltransferase involved in cell wall biosynthesis
MNDTPKVSVIIPTYNRGKIIGRSIHSVVNQTFQDIEIIIVDDCSSDNTRDVVAGFKDPRIKYIRHDVNKGGAAARNTGINEALGEFIAFQDSDDEWVLEKLEKQMRVMSMSSDDVGIVYSSYLLVKNNHVSFVPSNEEVSTDGDVLFQLLKKNVVGTPTVVIRKICFEKLGLFDESLPRYQDWDLFIRFAKMFKFRFVDEPLLISHYMTDSITADNIAAINARKIIFNKNYSEIVKDNKLLANFLFDTGTFCCKFGQYEEGRKYIFQAVRAHYMNAKYWPAALVSILGKNVYISVSKFTSRI